jgi:hypothetical protein
MATATVSTKDVVAKDNVSAILDRALDAGGGLLRLTPTWVPRSFLHPGKRIKLAPTDWYAYGAHRGGIDERWFASTTEAANDNRTPDEGLSYVAFEKQRFTLRDAVTEGGARLVGKAMFDKYKRWPQLNNVDNNFAYTFMGLEPGTTRQQLRRCLENWSKGDNGILDLSRAFRLKRGTGWLIPPGVLHAPGSLCTYEPQWGSDVFGMFQSLVEGREVPWALLVKDVPKEKHQDLDFIIDQLDWEKNVDTHFKEHNYLETIVDDSRSGQGYTDRWIVYGTIDGAQLFSAKELTVEPGAKCKIQEPGASGWITVQGRGRMGKLALQTPAMIHFGQHTEDEVFITHEAANSGVEVENTGSEPLVGLRYFGPDTHAKLPKVGDYKK